ncbi:MAG: Na+/H+ antiporter subunit E [Trueperaceae bacterium]
MRTAKSTVVLFAFWCVVVPPAGVADLGVGLVASVALAFWSTRFLGPVRGPVVHPGRGLAFAARHVFRIVAAASHVLRVVFDPKLPIDPVVVELTVPLGHDAARVAYANAVTITPGTLTVDVDGDAFVVHCLDAALADELRAGTVAGEVAVLFEGRSA